MSYAKTPSDLKAELLEQIEFMRDSCRNYDSGKVAEGKRIALAMRILLHDKGRNTRALLSQLSIKESLSYCSFGDVCHNPERMILCNALSMNFSAGAAPSLAPNLWPPPNRLKFIDWWNGIQLKTHAVSLTRSDIVLSVADTDGGAHVDPDLRGGYATLAKENGIGWITDGHGMQYVNSEEIGAAGHPIDGKHELMFIRQIAHELLSTFDEQLATILSAVA